MNISRSAGIQLVYTVNTITALFSSRSGTPPIASDLSDPTVLEVLMIQQHHYFVLQNSYMKVVG